MKKLTAMLVILLLSSGPVMAGGDQNQGTTGEGPMTTGTTAPGEASQPRAGR